MSRRDYPRIGYDGAMKGKKQCDCCAKGVAVRKVTLEVNWFRGDDEVYKLCAVHYALVKEEKFVTLEGLAEIEKDRRRALNVKPVSKPVGVNHEAHPCAVE